MLSATNGRQYHGVIFSVLPLRLNILVCTTPISSNVSAGLHSVGLILHVLDGQNKCSLLVAEWLKNKIGGAFFKGRYYIKECVAFFGGRLALWQKWQSQISVTGNACFKRAHKIDLLANNSITYFLNNFLHHEAFLLYPFAPSVDCSCWTGKVSAQVARSFSRPDRIRMLRIQAYEPDRLC